ncbi:hypothetical protein E7742_08410 [Rhodococcus sp. SGAir0479]|nr:hypothetical protein [Rhodococcus sp. SGAir0479]QCQ91258.1 hypothetical protein E7742_08410 [Rhodococcus sp. SGAir0479]
MSTSVPLPGRHLPHSGDGVDPADVHARVDALLAELGDAGGDHARQAHILERAHDVLVESLAAVDKV